MLRVFFFSINLTVIRLYDCNNRYIVVQFSVGEPETLNVLPNRGREKRSGQILVFTDTKTHKVRTSHEQ